MTITLTGTNDYARQQAQRQLVQDFVAEHGDLGLEIYDGDELDPKRLPSILQALPFLASKRLVVLRQPSAQKAVQEDLEQLLDTPSDRTELVIVEPKPDKRTSYYKALQKQTDFREFKELNEHQLANWLTDQAKAGQGSLSLADANFLVQRVGLNQQLLANELQKLLNYRPQITRQTIIELTTPTPQSTTFDLLDAAMAGQQAKLLQLYQEQRQQKVEPLAILGLVAWQLYALALVKTAGTRQPKLNPYVLRKTQAIARRCTLTEVKNWLHAARQLDVRLKTQSIDADEALLNFLCSLSPTTS